jgi:hypothetical protein
MIRRSLFAVVVWLFAATAFSSNRPFRSYRVTVDHQGQVFQSLDGDSVTSVPLETEVRARRWKVGVDYPPALLGSNRVLLVNSTSLEGIAIDWNGLPVGHPLSEVDRLAGLTHRVRLAWRLRDRWRASLFTSLGFQGDWARFSGRMAQWRGGAVVSRALGANVDLGLGAGLLNEFGEPGIYPILTLGLHSEERLDSAPPGTHVVSLRIPVSAAYWYVLSERVRAGAEIKALGGSYFLTREGPYRKTTLDMSQVQLGPAVHWRLARGFAVEANVGVAARRRWFIHSGNTELEKLMIKNAGFARVDLSWKIGSAAWDE